MYKILRGTRGTAERISVMEFWKKYLSNVGKGLLYFLQGLDKCLNALCFGDPEEYISSRIGKRRDDAERVWAWIVDRLFFWDKNHTRDAVQKDEGGDALL